MSFAKVFEFFAIVLDVLVLLVLFVPILICLIAAPFWAYYVLISAWLSSKKPKTTADDMNFST